MEDFKKHLAAQERSGKSVSEYCRQYGIDPKRLYYWRRRAGKRPGQFVEVGGTSMKGYELKLPADLKVYLFMQAMDMRCGFDRLAALVEERLQCSVLSGGMFVFFSRERRRVKLLWWDRDGYAIFYKRLEAGIFEVEWIDGCEEITGVDFEELLRGVDLSRIKMRRAAENGLYA